MHKRPRQKKRRGTEASGGRPDESFKAHGLRVSRYGATLAFESTLSPQEYAALQGRLVESYPKVRARISKHVQGALAIVRGVNPVTLLQRSYWGMHMSFSETGPEESSQRAEQVVSRLMVDYVQRLVCAVAPAGEAPDVTDQQYRRLHRHVTSIYSLFQLFFIARSASRKLEPDYDRDFDEFQVHAENLWMFVAGERYQCHAVQHLQALLREQDTLLRTSIGVSAAEIVRGYEIVQDALIAGGMRSIERLFTAFEGVRERIAGGDFDLGEWLRESGQREDLTGDLDRAFGLRLFDAELNTAWPKSLLDLISVDVGTDTRMVENPECGGWPTQPSVVDTRPVVRYGGRYYVFSQLGFGDRVYRAIERAVAQAGDRARKSWNDSQRRASERATLDLLSSVLPGCEVIPGAFYHGEADDGGPKLTECDGLVLYDNHLLVVEVKAGGAERRRSPTIDPKAHMNAMQNLVADPIGQGRRFVRALQRNGGVDLLDRGGRFVRRLSSTFESVRVIAVTVESLDIATQAEHFKWLAIGRAENPVWVLSLDDLRVVVEILSNPVDFMHFVAQRLAAFKSPAVRMSDELDHLGAYLQHSQYHRRAEEMFASGPMGWGGYRDDLDRYFGARTAGQDAPERPQQSMPVLMRSLLTTIASQRKPGHVSAGGHIIDGDDSGRDLLFAAMQESIDHHRLTGRVRPVSTHGEWPITLFTGIASAPPVSRELARVHACAVFQLSGGLRRLLLIARVGASGVENVEFEWITNDTAKAVGEAALAPVRHRLFASRRARRALP